MGEKDDILRFETRDSLDRDAALWVARGDAHELSASEQAEFETWLAASPNRRAAYERAAGLWQDLDSLGAYCRAENPSAKRSFVVQPAIKMMAFAACIMLMLGMAVLLVKGPDAAPDTVRHITAIGEQRKIALADGSSIMLNTNSDLEVLYSDTVRLIRLHRGEAYFEVAKDKNRRFRVDAGDNAVVAVGTAFVVHRKINAVDVAVTHGVVELQKAEASTNREDPAPAANEKPAQQVEKVWKPVAAMVVGQTATLSRTAGDVIRESQPDIDRILDWTDGSLVFQGEPLSEVVKSISRYSGYRFEIEDSELNALRIGAVFKVGDVTGLVEALEATFGVEAQYVGEAEIKLTRPRKSS